MYVSMSKMITFVWKMLYIILNSECLFYFLQLEAKWFMCNIPITQSWKQNLHNILQG